MATLTYDNCNSSAAEKIRSFSAAELIYMAKKLKT